MSVNNEQAVNSPIPIVKKPWYSVWGERYNGNQPSFYKREDLPWVSVLEDNWEVMRDELLTLIEDKPSHLQPYFINETMAFPPKKWKTMGLLYWKFKIHKNCKRCPKTMAVINSIDKITSFSISVLEPGSNINPHQGDTDAVIRCHLGLIIPGELPNLGFQVGKDIKGWQEGQCLPFCDAITHTAWNHTDERRIIINLDVMRKELLKEQNSICAHVLASSVLQMLYPRLPFLSSKTGYWRKAIYHFVRILIKGILPIQRRWSI